MVSILRNLSGSTLLTYSTPEIMSYLEFIDFSTQVIETQISERFFSLFWFEM